MKDDTIRQKVLECAKEEFLEKGFLDASMRAIAKRAGYTTGMLYSRFSDKDAMFRALVEEGAEKLYSYFVKVQNEFASFEPERQLKEMHAYVDTKVDHMIDIIYSHFDAFRLIVSKSAGSSYEYYIEKMIAIEMKHTDRYIELLQGLGVAVQPVRSDLNHMLASALFKGIFEVVAHELPREDAVSYIKQIQIFFNAGWDKLFGLSEKI